MIKQRRALRGALTLAMAAGVAVSVLTVANATLASTGDRHRRPVESQGVARLC